MYVSSCRSSDMGDVSKIEEHWQNMFGPAHVDQSVRSAITACWMALPKDRKTPEALEQEMRRLFERALKDFKEDCKAFIN